MANFQHVEDSVVLRDAHPFPDEAAFNTYTSFQAGSFYSIPSINTLRFCNATTDGTFANSTFIPITGTTAPQVENRSIEITSAVFSLAPQEPANEYFLYSALTGNVTLTPGGSYTTIESSLGSGTSLAVDAAQELTVVGIGTTLFIEPYAGSATGGLTWRGDITADPSPALKASEYGLDATGGAFTIDLSAIVANEGDEVAFTRVDSSTNVITVTGGANGDRLIRGQGTRWTFKRSSAGWLAIPQPANIEDSRLGEFFWAKSGSKLIGDGYLAVNPGTIANGATTYPKWAALYPEFISGNDIVFPADVEGMFLRNLGGEAAAEGAFQDDATAANGLRVAGSATNQTTAGSLYAKAVDSLSPSGPRDLTFSQEDSETRPFNRAYQLYTVVDGHNLQVPAGTTEINTSNAGNDSGGYVDMGGIRYQHGYQQVAGAGNAQTIINFPVPFSQLLGLSMTLQWVYNAASNGVLTSRGIVADGNPSNTGFACRGTGDVNVLDGVRWTAWGLK